MLGADTVSSGIDAGPDLEARVFFVEKAVSKLIIEFRKLDAKVSAVGDGMRQHENQFTALATTVKTVETTASQRCELMEDRAQSGIHTFGSGLTATNDVVSDMKHAMAALKSEMESVKSAMSREFDRSKVSLEAVGEESKEALNEAVETWAAYGDELQVKNRQSLESAKRVSNEQMAHLKQIVDEHYRANESERESLAQILRETSQRTSQFQASMRTFTERFQENTHSSLNSLQGTVESEIKYLDTILRAEIKARLAKEQKLREEVTKQSAVSAQLSEMTQQTLESTANGLTNARNSQLAEFGDVVCDMLSQIFTELDTVKHSQNGSAPMGRRPPSPSPMLQSIIQTTPYKSSATRHIESPRSVSRKLEHFRRKLETALRKGAEMQWAKMVPLQTMQLRTRVPVATGSVLLSTSPQLSGGQSPADSIERLLQRTLGTVPSTDSPEDDGSSSNAKSMDSATIEAALDSSQPLDADFALQLLGKEKSAKNSVEFVEEFAIETDLNQSGLFAQMVSRSELRPVTADETLSCSVEAEPSPESAETESESVYEMEEAHSSEMEDEPQIEVCETKAAFESTDFLMDVSAISPKDEMPQSASFVQTEDTEIIEEQSEVVYSEDDDINVDSLLDDTILAAAKKEDD